MYSNNQDQTVNTVVYYAHSLL